MTISTLVETETRPCSIKRRPQAGFYKLRKDKAMTVYELIQLLAKRPMDYVVYIYSPDGEQDYFVDEVSQIDARKEVHIRTSE